VAVKAGLRGMGSVVTMPDNASAPQLGYVHSQGYSEPVFAVEAYNKDAAPRRSSALTSSSTTAVRSG
jgi:hypothetical protein